MKYVFTMPFVPRHIKQVMQEVF